MQKSTQETYVRPSPISCTAVENYDGALDDLVTPMRSKQLAAEVMVKLGKINFPNAEFSEAVRQAKLGYVVLIAEGCSAAE